MNLRKKAFTLVEMLVVIMIISLLAAALFPAISGALGQAKSTAMKNKGRGIWVGVVSANSEREALSMSSVWPTFSYATSSDYFKYLMGNNNGTLVSPVCEDLKPATLAGSGVPAAADPLSFGGGNNAWCFAAPASSNVASEDAFVFTRNIDVVTQTGAGGTTKSCDTASLTTEPTKLGNFSLNRGVFVTYGGACIDRRDKYIGTDNNGNPTNSLVSSTNEVKLVRPI